MDDDARYEVLRNDEEQYSLWPAGHEVPAGWHRVGREGSREECSAYVDEVSTDMRPRSLREQMARSDSSAGERSAGERSGGERSGGEGPAGEGSAGG